jgi:hypothetical protein
VLSVAISPRFQRCWIRQFFQFLSLEFPFPIAASAGLLSYSSGGASGFEGALNIFCQFEIKFLYFFILASELARYE